MEQITHKFFELNGLKHHVAEIGSENSPAIVFLHGFPEIWYSWRYQMIAVAKAGFRAIAPDLRGYGFTDPQPEPGKTTFADMVNDVDGLLDYLSISKAYFVAKDFGSWVAMLFAIRHPKKAMGVVTLGIPFLPPIPPDFHGLLPEGFYISRFQKPGRAEADFGRLDNKTVVRNIYILFSRTEIPIANEDQEIMDIVDPSTPLPPWFTEEDLAAYGSLYEKSGFQTSLTVPYRSLGEVSNITDIEVQVPGLLIMGEKDYLFKFPGMEDYTRTEQGKKFFLNSETIYIPEGTHFVQEQLPDQINQLLFSFIGSHKYTQVQ